MSFEAFKNGFLKRANQWHVPADKAHDMFNWIIEKYYNAKGFTDRQLGKEANEVPFSESWNSIKDNLYPNSGDSVFDVATRIQPQIQDSKHKSMHEIMEIMKHMGGHGIAPGLAGAGVGGLMGAVGGKDGEKGKSARKGALIGGSLGFGSGVLSDAYHLGDNTRSEILNEYQQERENLVGQESKMSPKEKHHAYEQDDNIKKNMDTAKNSFWYEYFFPGHMQNKLQ